MKIRYRHAIAAALLLATLVPASLFAQGRTLQPFGRRAPSGASGNPAIGIAAPLSGPHQSFGEPVVRGTRLALRGKGGLPVMRTVLLDTRGTAEGAIEAFQRFASDSSIIAVIGPMSRAGTQAVAPLARHSGLAALSLSADPGSPEDGVLRFGMSRDDQARVLAEHAVEELGLQTWAIIHPDDGYGSELAAAFRANVRRLGGDVAATVSYAPGKTDYQAEVRRLRLALGMGELKPGRKRKLREEDIEVELLPQVPVDGVFIPDSAERVSIIASHLAFFDIRRVQLLGSSGWNDPELTRSRTSNLDGAIFVDAFFRYSFAQPVRDFVDAYRDSHASDPSVLDAVAYDAAALLRHLVGSGARTREAIRDRLMRPLIFDGASGRSVFGVGGQTRRNLFLLSLQGGVVSEVPRPEGGYRGTGRSGARSALGLN